MSAVRDADRVLCHIRHAEEWLRWARSDYRRGDARGAVLRLLLAEAEVQHAREAGTLVSAGPVPRSTRRRRVPAALAGALGAAAAVLAVAGYAALQAGRGAAPEASAPRVPAVSAAPAPRLAPVVGTGDVVQLETGDFLMPAPLPSGETAPGGGTIRVFGGVPQDLARFGAVSQAPADGPAHLGAPGNPRQPSATF